MRSCTGWPSGTWIDPPRRTAPDGSNFQLQHWTHPSSTRWSSGDGDWRRPLPGQQRGVRPPLVRRETTAPPVVCRRGDRCWRSSPRGACARRAEGGGQPAGKRRVGTSEPADGVALRLVETPGVATDVVIRSGLRRVSTAVASTCSNSPIQHLSDGLALHGYEIATVLTRLNLPKVLERAHGAGPRRRGGAAALCAVLAAQSWARAARRAAAVATCIRSNRRRAGFSSAAAADRASDCSDRAARQGPAGVPGRLDDRPAELPFMLPPGGHLETDVVVTMPAAVSPGCTRSGRNSH